MTNHVVLTIKREGGDRVGWRIYGPNGRYRPNPEVDEGWTVSWRVLGATAKVVILDDSPFLKDGKPLRNAVIDVEAGAGTEPVTVAPGTKREGIPYEYAVLVQEEPHQFIYVRGASSPPGVVVGGP